MMASFLRLIFYFSNGTHQGLEHAAPGSGRVTTPGGG